MTNLSPAVQAYQTAHIAFDKIKNTLTRLVLDDRIIDDHILDTYKEARKTLTQAMDTLNAEHEAQS
jgi:hypothetical protein